MLATGFYKPSQAIACSRRILRNRPLDRQSNVWPCLVNATSRRELHRTSELGISRRKSRAQRFPQSEFQFAAESAGAGLETEEIEKIPIQEVIWRPEDNVSSNLHEGRAAHSFSAPGPFSKIELVQKRPSASWEVYLRGHKGIFKDQLPRVWLRDHCQCSECLHPATKQRQFDILKESSCNIANCEVDEDGLQITWQEGNHSSWYSRDFLFGALSKADWLEKQFALFRTKYWIPQNGVSIQNAPPEVEYKKVMESNEGLAEWTRKIQEYGFCFVNGCPTTPEATEELLAKIGPIRNTHYGAFWDFTSDLASKDTAYTSLGLDLHTDTSYFNDPAGLQLFHLLSHEGKGGETQLVDGFRAANKLREENRDLFDILKDVKMHFHASGNEGITLQPSFAHNIVDIHIVKSVEAVFRIIWNNYDRATFPIRMNKSLESCRDWYTAAKRFDEIIHSGSRDLHYEFQLKPGRPLIFNNWRVLHGRSAFDGQRRMCGGYINMDDFLSRYKTTNWGWEAAAAMGTL